MPGPLQALAWWGEPAAVRSVARHRWRGQRSGWVLGLFKHEPRRTGGSPSVSDFQFPVRVTDGHPSSAPHSRTKTSPKTRKHPGQARSSRSKLDWSLKL